MTPHSFSPGIQAFAGAVNRPNSRGTLRSGRVRMARSSLRTTLVWPYHVGRDCYCGYGRRAGSLVLLVNLNLLLLLDDFRSSNHSGPVCCLLFFLLRQPQPSLCHVDQRGPVHEPLSSRTRYAQPLSTIARGVGTVQPCYASRAAPWSGM